MDWAPDPSIPLARPMLMAELYSFIVTMRQPSLMATPLPTRCSRRDDAESGIADQDGLDEQVPFRDWQGVGWCDEIEQWHRRFRSLPRKPAA